MPVGLLEREPRVAFLDDDLKFLKSVAMWQEVSDLPQLSTSEPDRCVAWAQEGAADMIVSDLRMPGEDGVSVLERISSVNTKIQLILLTGYEPTEEEKGRLERIGAKVFRKGRDFRELLETISKRPREDSTEQVIELLGRVLELEEIHRAWVEDLLEQLRSIPNAEDVWISGGEEEFTVEELITDIRVLNARGRRYLDLWLRARKTLRELGHKI